MIANARWDVFPGNRINRKARYDATEAAVKCVP